MHLHHASLNGFALQVWKKLLVFGTSTVLILATIEVLLVWIWLQLTLFSCVCSLGRHTSKISLIHESTHHKMGTGPFWHNHWPQGRECSGTLCISQRSPHKVSVVNTGTATGLSPSPLEVTLVHLTIRTTNNRCLMKLRQQLGHTHPPMIRTALLVGSRGSIRHTY